PLGFVLAHVEEINKDGNKQDASADSDYAGKRSHHQTKQYVEKSHARNDSGNNFFLVKNSGECWRALLLVDGSSAGQVALTLPRSECYFKEFGGCPRSASVHHNLKIILHGRDTQA